MTYSRRELTGQQGKIHCIDHGEMGMGLDLVEFVIAHVSAASSSPALRCQQIVDFERDEDFESLSPLPPPSKAHRLSPPSAESNSAA